MRPERIRLVRVGELVEARVHDGRVRTHVLLDQHLLFFELREPLKELVHFGFAVDVAIAFG